MKNKSVTIIKDYINYLDKKLVIDNTMVSLAFEKTILDVKYHYPLLIPEDITNSIIYNNNELAIFLFRLGRIFYNAGNQTAISITHGLIRCLCSCEIYFSNDIDEGFYLVHSTGTVIGSRNRIGKGFMIYQNCTIGHGFDDENGTEIGNNVTMLPYSSIIGSVRIGNNVVLGAYSFLKTDCDDNQILGGVPARVISNDSSETRKRFRPNI
jgi:serine O-acetyltransferase